MEAWKRKKEVETNPREKKPRQNHSQLGIPELEERSKRIKEESKNND